MLLRPQPGPGSGTDLVADHGNIADSGQWPPSSQQPAASRCSSRCSAGQVSEGRKLGIRSGQAETGQHMLSWGSLSSALWWYTNTGLLLLLVTKVYSDSL